jgi:large subunit ribosomal protein L17
MFKNMANSVILEEQVVTSVQKAKEVRRVVDRLITLAKKGNDASRRLAFDRTRSNEVVKKLFTVLADRYKARNGGYTRVLKLVDRRWGDAAEMAVLQLVDRAELKRGKQIKASQAADGQGAEASQGSQGPKDPLARVKKAFAGKSRPAGTGKAGKATESGKAAKAPARKASSRGKSGASSA